MTTEKLWEKRARVLKEVVCIQADEIVELYDEIRGLAGILDTISTQLAQEVVRLNNFLDKIND